ncbi:CRISPR-associated endoribonuclease Cas6 [Fusicatenibacter sp.]
MTELKLEFQLEKQELPIELDRLLLSFFKASIANYSPELFERLYNKKESVIKTYCWACYLPGARFDADKIRLKENRFTVTFSDADMGELFEFFNAFRMMQKIDYPLQQNSMRLTVVKAQRVPEINESEIIIKMQSSLLVREHRVEDNTDIYYTCEDPEFTEKMKENIKLFLERKQIYLNMDGFSITPVKGKKIVAKVWGRPTNASIGIYRLTGSPRLLNMLQLAGIGSRRSEGHGKWEIIW